MERLPLKAMYSYPRSRTIVHLVLASWGHDHSFYHTERKSAKAQSTAKTQA